jgi:septum formation inhibitor-activating ATPase MinD
VTRPCFSAPIQVLSLDAIENTHRSRSTRISKASSSKTASGLCLLAAPDQATQASIDPRRLRAVVEMALRAYRYVIIDAGRFDAPSRKARPRIELIVVATQELAAIRRGARAAQHCDSGTAPTASRWC